MAQILVVDDDPALRGLLALICRRAGYEVDEARGGEEALQMIEQRHYNIVILDLQMPGVNGFDVVKRIRERSLRPFVVVLTALPPQATTGIDPDVAQVVIRKPFDVDLLTSVLTELIERTRRQRSGDENVIPFRDIG